MPLVSFVSAFIKACACLKATKRMEAEARRSVQIDERSKSEESLATRKRLRKDWV
jgi:hypothetical protein